MDENNYLHPRGVDAETLGHQPSPFQGADGAAGARVEQIMHRQQRQQRQYPDQIIEPAAGVERQTKKINDGNIGDTGIAAEKFHVAEQEIQADAPGNGSQRQVMARKPKTDKAKKKGNGESKHQPHWQSQPG